MITATAELPRRRALHDLNERRDPDDGPRRVRWWSGWTPVIMLPAAAFVLFPATAPRWELMWAIALAMYVSAKWLTWRRTPMVAPSWKHAAYLLAWPGMDAGAFLRSHSTRIIDSPSAGEWLSAAVKTACGLAIFLGATRLVPAEHWIGVAWTGMVGLILMLHCGVFHLLSCVWRRLGVDARPLMQRPLAARSVSDFWGRRWNTAFRDLCYRFVFRPVATRAGAGWASAAVFFASGLVHECVISLPAGGGFGGPTLYFALQWAALCIERGKPGRRLGLGRGWRGWLFTAAVVLGPAPILFHPTFIKAVVLPMLHAWRAIP